VLIKPESSYKLGDVITFGADSKTQIPTTHRIVGISSDTNAVYTTKGDANDAPDPVATHFSDIHGKVLFSLSYLGYVLAFARTPLGFGLLVGVPALAIILEEVGKIIREIQAMRRSKRAGRRDTGETIPHSSAVQMRGGNFYITHEHQTYRLTNVVDLRR
jgi:signal peptidase